MSASLAALAAVPDAGRPARPGAATVALCICTCRRPHGLDRLLATLARNGLGLPPGIEGRIVVCDNRPDGAARAVCEGRRPQLPVPLSFVEEPQPGVSFARNRAADTALALGASLVAFIDDDDEPEQDWLEQLVRVQAATGADMIFGAWRRPADLVVPPHLARVRFFQPVRLDKRNGYGLPAWAGTFNLLLTRRLAERMRAEGGLFRPEFALTGSEDMDLFVRARRAGLVDASATASLVVRGWDQDRMTVRGVLRQAFRGGYARAHLTRHHLTPPERRALYRASATELAATLVAMPGRATRPAKLVPLLVRAAGRAGELYAAAGGRFRYYRDRDRGPVPVDGGDKGAVLAPAARGGTGATSAALDDGRRP